jgi:cation:H+ antiporter
VLLIFAIASIVTLIAGVVLEESGNVIADHIGLSGVLFGSTILAAATALPEVSTGLASVNIGDYSLAISDIFGGNAFLPVLFLPATLLSGQSVLPQAKNTDIYLASLGVLLTAVYIYGLIFRPKRQFLDLGIDSIVVLVLYIVGIVGLFTIAGGK